MASEDIDVVTKILIEDTSSHQSESVAVVQKSEAEMIPERKNAIKIPLDNVIKK
ncbi:MAG: hypothetical protein RLZZ223_493 [Candidatus Parcubacteria bacterium]|jgi:hypothetical protein